MMVFNIEEVDDNSRDKVVKNIIKQWGSSNIITKGTVHDTMILPGFVAMEGGNIKGIVMYCIENDECEIITLDSFLSNTGIGSQLIEKVEETALNKKCKRIWLITTNDNSYAIRFYQRRGYDLKAIYHDAIIESRKFKPEIPLIGLDDIPLRHELEFEKILE